MTVAQACRLLKCTEYRLAKLLDLTQGAITRWGRQVPDKYHARVHALVKERRP